MGSREQPPDTRESRRTLQLSVLEVAIAAERFRRVRALAAEDGAPIDLLLAMDDLLAAANAALCSVDRLLCSLPLER